MTKGTNFSCGRLTKSEHPFLASVDLSRCQNKEHTLNVHVSAYITVISVKRIPVCAQVIDHKYTDRRQMISVWTNTLAAVQMQCRGKVASDFKIFMDHILPQFLVS